MLVVGLLGCPRPDDEPHYDLEALQDPETCAECHPQHYREWLGSMHAYAAEDPVFRAMNARAQRESGGALGDFCVRCHAPVAVELGLTTDGLNLDELPQKTKGVTCWFCHQVDAIEGTHNNPLRLALDGLMRGSVVDPLEPDAHAVGTSEHFDRDRLASAGLCGTCHDIVSPAGAHIERTYAEWQASFYADASESDPGEVALYGLTCNECHMSKTVGAIADYPGVRGDRARHSHMFGGVDVAVSDFPDAELGPQLRAEQREAIAEQRKSALCASLCVRPLEGAGGAEVTVFLHNEAAGHSWPSGSTPDRRAWVELIVRDAGDAAVFESGVVADDEPIAELDDPNLWLLRDRVFDAEGNETHLFWEAASYESSLLGVPSEFGVVAHAQTWQSRSYMVDPAQLGGEQPSRVSMRVRLRPIGLEILAELVESGDLDPAVVERFETFDVAPTLLEWTAASAEPSLGEVDYGSCVSSSPGCMAPALEQPL